MVVLARNNAKQVNQPRERRDELEWAIKQLYNRKHSDKFYEKLDPHQKEAYDCLLSDKYNVVIFDAKAGCGKTTLAFLAGLNMLRDGKVAQVLYIRIPDIRAGKLGFLPGELDEKESIYMQPAYDACLENGLQPHAVDALRMKGMIEFGTDVTMRGRNLKDCFVIIDEPQNADMETLRLILTRLHDNSKCVLSGHSGQMDNPPERFGKEGFNAFEVYTLHLLLKPWAVKCSLPINYRGKVSRWADDIDTTINDIQGENNGQDAPKPRKRAKKSQPEEGQAQ